ncbi:hypothetical protein ACWIG5_16070 [Streptomyces lydicus]
MERLDQLVEALPELQLLGEECPTSTRGLHQRCQSALDQLSLPRPFTIDALCQELSAQRKRPLHLHPLPEQAARNSICGMWLATKTDDHIFFEKRTSRVHQEHIVLHEIGHMLFDHRGADLEHGEVPQVLFPDLNPQVVQQVLGRASYTNRQEQEAEMLASLLRIRAKFTPSDAGEPADSLNQLVRGIERGRAGNCRSPLSLVYRAQSRNHREGASPRHPACPALFTLPLWPEKGSRRVRGRAAGGVTRHIITVRVAGTSSGEIP